MTEQIDLDRPDDTDEPNGNFPLVKFCHRLDEAVDGGRGVLTGSQMLGTLFLTMVSLAVEVLHDSDLEDIDDLIVDDDDDGVPA